MRRAAGATTQPAAVAVEQRRRPPPRRWVRRHKGWQRLLLHPAHARSVGWRRVASPSLHQQLPHHQFNSKRPIPGRRTRQVPERTAAGRTGHDVQRRSDGTGTLTRRREAAAIKSSSRGEAGRPRHPRARVFERHPPPASRPLHPRSWLRPRARAAPPRARLAGSGRPPRALPGPPRAPGRASVPAPCAPAQPRRSRPPA